MNAAAGAIPAAADQQRGSPVASLLVLAALLFNFALAFVNASVAPISPAMVMAAEVVILGIAAFMVASRCESFYFVALAVVAWLVFAMAVRSNFDPKCIRDAFIPIIFFFLGRYFATPRTGDRLVLAALLVVAAGAIFEWGFLGAYLQYFDVLGYFRAKGSLDAGIGDGAPGLFVSGERFEGRTLLPFLGEHRVSSIFLEPVSIGNFGAIVFAWVLARDYARPMALIGKILLIAGILVLGDARFGFYLCGLIVAVYLVAPLIRPTMVFVVPFLTIIGILIYVGQNPGVPWDNTIFGRFLLSGQLMSNLNLTQALGLQTSPVNFDDSGYSYVLSQFGLFGGGLLWAIYVYGAPAETPQAWRFKLFACMYLVLLLAISTSSMTIKTGALLWFLAGCIAQGERAAPSSRSQVPLARTSPA